MEALSICQSRSFTHHSGITTWRWSRIQRVLDCSICGQRLPGRRLHSGGVASFNSVRSQRSEEHTSELQSLMRISYAVFCLQTKKPQHHQQTALCTYNSSHKSPLIPILLNISLYTT